MARTRRHSKLETREARLRLAVRREPYWKQLEPGLSLGYRRTKSTGSWIVRRFNGTAYKFHKLAKADDYDDADGVRLLSYAEAQRKTLHHADGAAALEKLGASPDYTVGEALTDYFEWFKGHRKSSEQTGAVIRAHLRPTFDDVRVQDLTARQIREWHSGLARKRAKSTANRVLTVLKAALNLAWQEGYTASADAWGRVKPFRGADNAKVRALSAVECQRLLNASPGDFRTLVHAALLTGCRYGELCRLAAGDYNAKAGTLTVRESKSGKARHIPLTDEGCDLFDVATAGKQRNALVFAQDSGEPWGRYLQVRRMRDACKAAEIEPSASFHILRHTYGSMLAMQGVPLHVISEVMGHADTRMTSKHYAHLLPSYVAETVRANLPSFGGVASNVKRLSGRKARAKAAR